MLKNYRWSIGIFLLSRIIILSLLPVAIYMGKQFGFNAVGITWKGVENEFLNHWTAFDSEFYLMIAEYGYHLPESTAFFPLYPLLIKIISFIGINKALAGFILSLTSFLIGMIYMDKILIKYGKDKYSLWLIAFSPITVFFMAVYTESLFFCLTVVTFYYIEDKKWIIAGVFAGLTSLTRNSGTILFLIIAIELWKEKETYLSYIEMLFRKTIIGVFIFLSYPIYLWWTYGEPLKYITIQSEFWNRHFTLPWISVWVDIKRLTETPELYFSAYFNLFFLLIVFWMVVRWREVKFTYLLFVVFSVLLPLMAPTHYESMPYTAGLSRYLLVLFPVYIFISDRIKHPLLRIVLIEVMIGVMVMFLTSFVGKQFIG